MKHWIKTGICVLTAATMLPMTAFAAGLSMSFDQTGTTAHVQMTDVTTGRYAAEVTFSVKNAQNLQFESTAESHAITVDNDTVTLYIASRAPLNADSDKLDFGTLSVSPGTEVTAAGKAVLLDRALNRTELTGLTLDIRQDTGDTGNGDTDGDSGSQGGSSASGSGSSGSGSSSSTNKTPTVSVSGTGGKVKADQNGTVTITPDDGYRIAKILVNGKEVEITSKLTGLKSTDKVVVTFEKIEDGEDSQTPAPSVSFTDVPAGAWYAEAVSFVVARGLFQGDSATTFAPNADMNRAMLVTVLYRLSGDSAPAQAAGFTDVAAGTWYADAVAWAKANGIVSGVSSSQFAPAQSITREQTAAILSRYSAYKGHTLPTGSADFADRDQISDYAQQAVASMQAAGLIQGRENNRFAPKEKSTRAEVATILMRYVKMTEQ
nr:S-layer homology domain-containing protein [uncultured Butyricicoccus sp.]